MSGFSKIQWGDGLTATDAGAGVIRVDGGGGPAGATGPPGPAGPAGPTGPQGVSGTASFVSGTGPPTAAAGADGSVYLDVSTGTFYGPKASGAWPTTPLGHLVKGVSTYTELSSRYSTYAAVNTAFHNYTEMRGF